MDWKAIIVGPARLILEKMIGYFLKALAILVILVLGWFIAKAVQKVVTRFLKILQLDVAADKTGITKIFKNGEIKYTLSELIGVLVYWMVMLIVAVAAANALNLTVAAQLLDQIVIYIPNVILAILVLAIGIFLSYVASKAINTVAVNAGISQAKLLAKIAEVAIVVLSILIALDQLKIATTSINLIITIVLGAIGLALALAFGLGGKDVAAKLIKETLDKISDK